MNRMRKSIALLCAAFLLASLLAGCKSADKAGNTAVKDPKTVEEKLKLKVLMNYLSTEFPAKDHPIQKKLEEYTNADLDITWITYNGYADKLNAVINSGDLPDLLLLTNEKASQGLMNAQMFGVFWEVGPYLKNYKNLSRSNPGILEAISVDGKVNGIYRAREVARTGLFYRKDWADNMGLKTPQTVDELYTMLKMFTLNDPDKDGKDNSIGYYVYGKGYVNAIQDYWMSMFNAPYKWGEVNGKVTPAFMTKEFLEGMKFWKRMFQEKLMNQDFPVAQGPSTSGLSPDRQGVYANFLNQARQAQDNTLKKLDPKAEIEIIPKLKGEKKYAVNDGYNGMWCIPKQKVKTEAEMKRILAFLDKLNDKEMQDLLNYGIEGENYTLESGKVVRSAEQQKKWDSLDTCFGQIAMLDDLKLEQKKQPLDEKMDIIVKENTKDAVFNIAYPLTSETVLDKGMELDKIWQDAMTKFILGEIDEAGWNKEIETWKSKGGSKVMDEYTAAYSRAKKK